MTTPLENTADEILTLSREVGHLEAQLTYLSGIIASLAADGETDTDVFTSSVDLYRSARAEHRVAKTAYDTLLAE